MSGKILGASTSSFFLFDNLKDTSIALVALDILIVATLFYWVFVFLKETRAMRILYGIIFFVALGALGNILNLYLLNWLFKFSMAGLVVAIPVVFQPELRAALEKLGRTKLIGELAFGKEENTKLINILVSASVNLAAKKIGALMVVQRQTGLREFIENGTFIDATASRDLIESIFFHKSPLHDGAAIIVGEKIESVRSILPVSPQSLPSALGTRHKAGVGISEISDAISIIISEETGQISIAHAGRLERRLNEEKLRNRLTQLLGRK